MSLSSNDRNTRSRQAFRSTGIPTPTTLGESSAQTNIPSYSRFDSGSDLSSTGWTSPECTSCFGEPDPAGNCRSLANAQRHLHLSGCLDPVCHEAICDECLDHEECCDECVVDCGSDCGVAFPCDEPDIRDDDTYTFEGSYSELFGDQTAQTFGFGRALPQLAKDDTIIESIDFCNVPELSPFTQHNSGSSQPNPNPRIPWAPGQPTSQQITPPNCTSTYQATFADILPLTHQSTSPLQVSESAPGSPDLTDTTPHAHHDHVSLLPGKSDSPRAFSSCVQCQWADPTGEPCGQILRPGEDMHEHLKSAHGVKNEVFCRWIGCSVGVSKVSPHKFANSVERHTWGHSGYRPYKCPACNEGFAAASVRDEHFTNIHLRKKMFACDMCSHQCTSATNLKRHKDDKHSAERFQCEFCNQNGKRRLFPRGPNLARHLRSCKYVLAQFHEAAPAGRAKTDWLPPGYKRGHHGMDRAKVIPPNYLPAQKNHNPLYLEHS